MFWACEKSWNTSKRGTIWRRLQKSNAAVLFNRVLPAKTFKKMLVFECLQFHFLRVHHGAWNLQKLNYLCMQRLHIRRSYLLSRFIPRGSLLDSTFNFHEKSNEDRRTCESSSTVAWPRRWESNGAVPQSCFVCLELLRSSLCCLDIFSEHFKTLRIAFQQAYHPHDLRYFRWRKTLLAHGYCRWNSRMWSGVFVYGLRVHSHSVPCENWSKSEVSCDEIQEMFWWWKIRRNSDQLRGLSHPNFKVSGGSEIKYLSILKADELVQKISSLDEFLSIRCIEEIKSIFKNVFAQKSCGLLFQVTISLLVLLDGRMDFAKQFFAIGLLILTLFQFGLLCFVGQRVISASSDLLDATYECAWFSQSLRIKKMLVIVRIVCHREISFGFLSLSFSCESVKDVRNFMNKKFSESTWRIGRGVEIRCVTVFLDDPKHILTLFQFLKLFTWTGDITHL